MSDEQLEELLERICLGVADSYRYIFKNAQRDQETADSTAKDTILFMLHKRGTMQVTELSGELMVSKANVSMLVTKLVKEDLVRKQQSELDKRVFHLVLTDAGQAYVRERYAMYRQYLAGRLQCLSAEEMREFTAAIGVLERLAAKIKNQKD